MVSAGSNVGGYTTYGYDPQGKRVSRQTIVSDVNYTDFYSEFTFYGITGQRLTSFTVGSSVGNQGPCNTGVRFCTFGPTPGYVYFGSKLIAEPNGSYWWPVSPYPPAQVAVVTDRLGSVRSGISYYPWGEEKTSPPTQDGQVKFGTYFRDMSGQDYADQRYYTAMGGEVLYPGPEGNACSGPKESYQLEHVCLRSR